MIPYSTLPNLIGYDDLEWQQDAFSVTTVLITLVGNFMLDILLLFWSK